LLRPVIALLLAFLLALLLAPLLALLEGVSISVVFREATQM